MAGGERPSSLALRRLTFRGNRFILTNYAFAKRPRTLWWIDAGHAVVACTAIGAVLGLAG